MRIGFRIKTLSRMIKKEIDNTPTFRQNENLTGIQGWVLRFLYDKEKAGEDVFQRDVERTFQIRRSTATELFNTMEQNGYVVRTPVERDARLKNSADREGQAPPGGGAVSDRRRRSIADQGLYGGGEGNADPAVGEIKGEFGVKSVYG